MNNDRFAHIVDENKSERDAHWVELFEYIKVLRAENKKLTGPPNIIRKLLDKVIDDLLPNQWGTEAWGYYSGLLLSTALLTVFFLFLIGSVATDFHRTMWPVETPITLGEYYLAVEVKESKDKTKKECHYVRQRCHNCNADVKSSKCIEDTEKAYTLMKKWNNERHRQSSRVSGGTDSKVKSHPVLRTPIPSVE